MSGRVRLMAAVTIAWVLGSALGSFSARPASAVAGIVVGTPTAHFAPELPGRRTITILAVGSDARPGQDPLRSRSDSLHLIFLNPERERAVIVGIPRDSWVPIPGHGSNKINASMSSGGPQLLVETIERTFGARIDYWAVTTFRGLSRMIGDVHGLEVRIPFRMRDSHSGSNFRPGLHRLAGYEVLSFARDRHSVPGGDFGRQENGGRVFLAALAQFQRDFRSDPAALLRWIGAGTRNIETDLSIQQLIDLALGVTALRPTHVRNVVFPGGTGSVGSSSVVFLAMDTARRIVADALQDGALKRANVPRSPTGHG